jgi:hypothetical protein
MRVHESTPRDEVGDVPSGHAVLLNEDPNMTADQRIGWS